MNTYHIVFTAANRQLERYITAESVQQALVKLDAAFPYDVIHIASITAGVHSGNIPNLNDGQAPLTHQEIPEFTAHTSSIVIERK